MSSISPARTSDVGNEALQDTREPDVGDDGEDVNHRAGRGEEVAHGHRMHSVGTSLNKSPGESVVTAEVAIGNTGHDLSGGANKPQSCSPEMSLPYATLAELTVEERKMRREARMTLRKLWKKYSKMAYKKGSTFDEIGKASAAMDVGEFLRFAADFGFVPTVLSRPRAKELFHRTKWVRVQRDSGDVMQGASLDPDEFVDAVQACCAEAEATFKDMIPEPIRELMEMVHCAGPAVLAAAAKRRQPSPSRRAAASVAITTALAKDHVRLGLRTFTLDVIKAMLSGGPHEGFGDWLTPRFATFASANGGELEVDELEKAANAYCKVGLDDPAQHISVVPSSCSPSPARLPRSKSPNTPNMSFQDSRSILSTNSVVEKYTKLLDETSPSQGSTARKQTKEAQKQDVAASRRDSAPTRQVSYAARSGSAPRGRKTKPPHEDAPQARQSQRKLNSGRYREQVREEQEHSIQRNTGKQVKHELTAEAGNGPTHAGKQRGIKHTAGSTDNKADSGATDSIGGRADPDATRENAASGDQQGESLRSLFESWDKNGDGTVNRREVISALRKDPAARELLGLPAKFAQNSTEHQAFEMVFQRLDADDSREITWTEFIEAVGIDASDDFTATHEQASKNEPQKRETLARSKTHTMADSMESRSAGVTSEAESGTAVSQPSPDHSYTISGQTQAVLEFRPQDIEQEIPQNPSTCREVEYVNVNVSAPSKSSHSTPPIENRCYQPSSTPALAGVGAEVPHAGGSDGGDTTLPRRDRALVDSSTPDDPQEKLAQAQEVLMSNLRSPSPTSERDVVYARSQQQRQVSARLFAAKVIIILAQSGL